MGIPPANLELGGYHRWRYPVYVGAGIATNPDLWRYLLRGAARIAVVTDTNVGPAVTAPILAATGKDPLVVTVPAGETAKSRAQKEAIEDTWFKAGLGRDTVVLAIGGGVVGDLAGFTAATYMRGIPVVQVPTSLVAMVDSAIGGKTGIDTPHGKNLIGAFHPPHAVVADVEALTTLPDAELRYGLAEVIKHGCIADASLLDLLEERSDAIFGRDAATLVDLVARNVRIKGRIVEADEREGGLRQVLNFGHTIGHAIERVTDYRVPHGAAVALGMLAEARLAQVYRGFPPDATARLAALLAAVGLPLRLQGLDATAGAIVAATVGDKKAREGRVRYALPHDLGAFAPDPDAGYAVPVSREDAEAAVAALF